MRISDWSSDVCSSDLRAASAAHAEWTGYEKAPLSRGFLSRAGNGPYIQPSSSCRSSLPSWLLSTASNSAVSVAFDFASPRLMLPLPLLSIAVKSTLRSEEHTSELQSLMRISYAVFCLQKKTHS